SRLADFGAFVEILPGTDGLLHISEVAEHRIKDVRDELKEGDQVLVKVLSIEGNRIRLSRKAILKEQRAKMGGSAVNGGSADASAAEGAMTIEGGAEYTAEESAEPNFNRAEAPAGGEPRPAGGAGRPDRDRGGRGGRGGGGHRGGRGHNGRGGRGGGGHGRH
ncbi:MAG TPA: S1 RNA-binding domain-containing protein, partial [Terriglobales bacterium]|nr:S1 RNA-binding domain-containing protein [Terriglobales bacterium]